MLSLLWMTLFIIFLYVPGSILNFTESPSSLLTLESHFGIDEQLPRGAEEARQPGFSVNASARPTITSTTETTKLLLSSSLFTPLSHPVTFATNTSDLISTTDPSVAVSSAPSLPASSSPPLSLPSTPLKIKLTQTTPATNKLAPSTSTTTITTVTTGRATLGVRNVLNESDDTSTGHGGKDNHRKSLGTGPVSITGYTSTGQLYWPQGGRSSIRKAKRVILPGNSFNWGYAGLESGEFLSRRAELSRVPLQAFFPPASSSSLGFPLSAASQLSSFPSPDILRSLSMRSSTSTTSTTTESTVAPPSDGYINITTQLGTHAYLPCNVRQFVKKPISWLRVRDGHILTVDQTTFIADQRFQSVYTANPERWSLQIKYVQIEDAGTYECQVSTEPKTSAIVSLNIVEPKTELIGEPIRHVKAGSQVKLYCVISQSLEPPLYINWYHNHQQIHLHNRKGWRTEIERDADENATNEAQFTIASLIIPSVGRRDSGNYTCSPSNSGPVTMVLHVLSGEYSASAITSGSSSNHRIYSSIQVNKVFHVFLGVISFLMCFGQLRHHQYGEAMTEDANTHHRRIAP